MGENEHIDQNHAARARTCVEIADQVNSQLDTLLMYMRSDHIGMVHGDGELTRYMTYLCSRMEQNLKMAKAEMRAANIPEELPF